MTNYRQTMADTLKLMYLMREYKLMERELTDTEKKRREEIAQDMDDADFKERYGDRWKEVKMAVATKQAKEEEFDLDEATKWKMGDGRPRGGSHIENVRFWDLSKDELQYIMKDAGEAMKANPTGRKAISGPGNYADQVNDAQTVLVWRKKNGIKEDVDLDEGWNIEVGAKVKMGKNYGKVIGKEKVMGEPGVEIKWDDGLKGRFPLSSLASASMDRKADYSISEEVDLDEVRQLKNPKKEVLVVKSGKVIVIDKKDAKEYLNKGWDLAEEVELDEAKEKKTWVVYNHDSGKPEKHFSNKISADRHMDKLNKKYEASGKLPYRVMQTEELELDEAKPLRWHLTHEYEVKYAKSKKGPIKISKFETLDQAKKFLADVKKDGMNGIISKHGKPVKEEVELDEDNMDLMRKAAKGAAQTLKMKDGNLKMDSFTASGIMQVYDGVNPKNKISMEKMINTGNKSQIVKLQSLAMRASKGGRRREEVELDEWTVSDVAIAMKKKYGKIDKEAIEKLKKVQHRGNVDRNDLVKVGHGKLHVESVDLDENIKVGDNVHLGFGAKGGVGFKGKVIKIDGENVHIKNPKGKEYKGPMKFVTIGESARSDAMRAIAKDKDLATGSDVEDDDDSATDADIKGASKNIIMQMRKAQNLRGKFVVEFEDKKKIKIPAKIAIAVQEKHNSFRKPRDKAKFAEKVAKSYKSMLSALKETVVGRENTIVDRISKKIQERKELHEARPLGRWELANKKFSLVYDKGTYILVTQGTGEEKKLKAKTPQDATQELVKKGYRES